MRGERSERVVAALDVLASFVEYRRSRHVGKHTLKPWIKHSKSVFFILASRVLLHDRSEAGARRVRDADGRRLGPPPSLARG